MANPSKFDLSRPNSPMKIDEDESISGESTANS